MEMARPTDARALEELASSLMAVSAVGREVVEEGPFRAFVAARSADYLLSFATPSGPKPAEWGPAIESLLALFGARRRKLRLEYFEELYPTLGPALERAGIRLEKTAPALVLQRGKLRPQLRATGGRYVNLTADGMEPFLVAQNNAFGMDPARALEWQSTLQASLEAGSVMMAATIIDETPVSGASIMIGGGAGELAGVWTARDRRRQGLSGDLCSRLLMDYFVAGHELAWLSADGDSWALYRKLGFTPVGTQLNYGTGDPDGYPSR